MTKIDSIDRIDNYFQFFTGTFSLNCMVGKGDLYNRPASKDDIENGNYPAMDAPFQSFKCGTRGSQLVNVDTLIKNVTDTVENSWNTFTESISNLATELTTNTEEKTRIKRQNGGEIDKQNYACVKIVLGYTAYRSCVPKYSTIRLNCSSIIGRNVVCYCHTDDCNLSPIFGSQPWIIVVFVCILMYLTA